MHRSGLLIAAVLSCEAASKLCRVCMQCTGAVQIQMEKKAHGSLYLYGDSASCPACLLLVSARSVSHLESSRTSVRIGILQMSLLGSIDLHSECKGPFPKERAQEDVLTSRPRVIPLFRGPHDVCTQVREVEVPLPSVPHTRGYGILSSRPSSRPQALYPANSSHHPNSAAH